MERVRPQRHSVDSHTVFPAALDVSVTDGGRVIRVRREETPPAGHLPELPCAVYLLQQATVGRGPVNPLLNHGVAWRHRASVERQPDSLSRRHNYDRLPQKSGLLPRVHVQLSGNCLRHRHRARCLIAQSIQPGDERVLQVVRIAVELMLECV